MCSLPLIISSWDAGGLLVIASIASAPCLLTLEYFLTDRIRYILTKVKTGSRNATLGYFIKSMDRQLGTMDPRSHDVSCYSWRVHPYYLRSFRCGWTFNQQSFLGHGTTKSEVGSKAYLYFYYLARRLVIRSHSLCPSRSWTERSIISCASCEAAQPGPVIAILQTPPLINVHDE